MLTYVINSRVKLTEDLGIARKNVEQSRVNTNRRFDIDIKERSFQPGDKVLFLLSVSGNASWVGEANYVLKTPDRIKGKQCLGNMIKRYIDREITEPFFLLVLSLMILIVCD